MTPGAQRAEGQVRMLPSLSLAFHSGVRSGADESVPPPASVRVTWVSGWEAFHASTSGCCAVPQAQYSRVMGPSVGSAPSSLALEQPVRSRAPAEITAAPRSVAFFIMSYLLVGRGHPPPLLPGRRT